MCQGVCHTLEHGEIGRTDSLSWRSSAALLCGGLVWGLAAALATSTTPAPAGKVVLKVGLTNGAPDSLNPFIGQSTSCYEIWGLNYDLMWALTPATGRIRKAPPRRGLPTTGRCPTAARSGRSTSGRASSGRTACR